MQFCLLRSSQLLPDPISCTISRLSLLGAKSWMGVAVPVFLRFTFIMRGGVDVAEVVPMTSVNSGLVALSFEDEAATLLWCCVDMADARGGFGDVGLVGQEGGDCPFFG